MKPEYIIIHHSLTKDSKTVSWDAIRNYHTKTLGWNDIGYHYGIELVGDHYEVLKGRFDNEQGAHARGVNHLSLGICFVGNFDVTPVPKAQWDLGISLVRSLCDGLNIPTYRVYGHHWFDQHKSCPGKLFDITAFKAAIKGAT